MVKSLYTVQIAIVVVCIIGFTTLAAANIDDALFTLGQKSLTMGELTIGYATAPADDDNTHEVLPYSEQKSFPVLNLESFWARNLTHLRFDSLVNGRNDFVAELHYDYNSRIRLSLLDESLVHRLDHLPLPPSSTQIVTNEYDTNAEYEQKFRQQDIALKLSPKFLASHLTLRYHRTERNGSKEMRYLDENCATQCHINSKTRQINQETQEFFVMADAHLGALEMSIDHLQRAHDDKAEIPTDSFGAVSAQHDVLPGNSYGLTTLKLHTSQAGGLVAAGSLSLGKRKNESEQTDISPIHAETDIFKAAGDLSWTPSPLLHFSTRYRISRIDNDVASAYLVPALLIPEAIDVTKNTFGVAAVWSPTRRLSLKADYQHDQILREHTNSASFWTLPQDEAIDKITVDLNYRPFIKSTTRFDLGYTLIHSSDPAYAMSNQNTYIIKANARISPATNWGIDAGLRGEKGENGGVVNTDNILYDRNSQKGDATFNAWYSPHQKLTLGTNFGYSHLLVEQDFRYGHYVVPTDGVASNVEMRQIVRSAAVNLNFAATRKLNCISEFHIIYGDYQYSPEFSSFNDGLNLLTSAGLDEAGHVDLRQNGFSAGLNWALRERLALGLRYLYDSYHDAQNRRLDETVQSFMLTASKSW